MPPRNALKKLVFLYSWSTITWKTWVVSSCCVSECLYHSPLWPLSCTGSAVHGLLPRPPTPDVRLQQHTELLHWMHSLTTGAQGSGASTDLTEFKKCLQCSQAHGVLGAALVRARSWTSMILVSSWQLRIFYNSLLLHWLLLLLLFCLDGGTCFCRSELQCLAIRSLKTLEWGFPFPVYWSQMGA